MTVLDPQISDDVLDDQEQRTEIWAKAREQVRKTGTIPRGTYEAKLREVSVIRRKDQGGFALRMIALTDHAQRYVVAWRGLSENPDDPYDLTEGQVKGLRKFATSMGIPVPAPAVEIVEALGRLMTEGAAVTAKVAQTVVGQTVTFSREPASTSPANGTIVVAGQVVGQVIDSNGELLEGKARDAFNAHTRIVGGLRAAHVGLAQAAEGCHLLLGSEGWTALGFENLSEYLAAPEITVSRTEFYRLAEIWEAYIIDGGAKPELLHGAAVTKLEVPLPALKAGIVSAEQAAADAEAMPRHDLRAHYRGLLGGTAGEGSGDGDVGDVTPEPESRRRDEPKSEPADEWKEKYHAAAQEANQVGYRNQELTDETERLRAEVERLQGAEALQQPAQAPTGGGGDDAMEALTQTVVSLLARVMREVGRPEQKRMSRALRERVIEVLDEAFERGLDVESE